MKKLLLFTAAFILSFQLYSQWFLQTSNTDIQLGSLCFINQDMGWILGLDTIENERILIKTNSGGSDWASIWSSSSIVGRNILFSDSLHGWWDGSQNYLRSEDGGFSWIANPDSLWAFDFVNDSDGFALKGHYGSSELLYKTSNGGITWTQLDTLPKYCYGNIDFVDKNIGYYSYIWGGGGGGSGQALMKTVDGGISWESRSLPYGGIGIGYTLLHFINENVGFTSILFGDERGLYKTLDGAESWEKIHDKYIYKKFFLTQDNGYIVTRNNTFDSCSIEHTSDGGESWFTQYSGTDNISDIFFTDSLNGWAVGDNGLILHTINGGGTVTHINKNKTNFKSLKVYPNPVSEAVTFEFVLKEQGMVVIDLYNSMGKKVSQPTSRNYLKGLHRLEWNASILDDGIYFCRFKIGKTSSTKHIIKIH